jgi:predicted nucleic acid-binding Zn ribbon protein
MARPRKRVNPGSLRVQEERFQVERLQPSREYADTTMGDLVPRLMKQLGLEDRYWEQALLNDWVAIVGEQVARRARPGRVQNQTLYVFVTNSAWLSELSRYGQKQMLENLQKRFGSDKIKSLRIQMDPDGR